MTTAAKPGVQEHILAALTRPMTEKEIHDSLPAVYSFAGVVKEIDRLSKLGKIRLGMMGWYILDPEPATTAPAPLATLTVAEWEALEKQEAGNGQAEPPASPPKPRAKKKTPDPIDQAVIENAFRPELHDVVGVLVDPQKRGSMLDSVDIEAIVESSLNPRQSFDEDDLAALAASIKQHGILQPLVVRDNPNPNGPARYELLAGARRFRACILAGLECVPVVTRWDVTDAQAIEIMLAENDDRADLNPIERALAYKRLAELGVSNKEIAKQAGLSPARVSNAMAVLDLSPPLQQQLAAGALTESHGRALLRHPERIRESLAEIAVAKGCSSKDLDMETGKLDYVLFSALKAAGVAESGCTFDLCKACPHDAVVMRYGRMEDAFCLNPSCHHEQAAAAQTAIAAANRFLLESAKQAAITAGRFGETAEILSLEELRQVFPGAARIYGDPNAVEGCSEQCKCRRLAYDTNSAGVVEIIEVCIDAPHREALRTVAREAYVQQRQAEMSMQDEEQAKIQSAILAAIQARPDDPALLVAAVGKLLWTFEDEDALVSVVARHIPKLNDEEYPEIGDVLDIVASVPTPTLARIAGELTLLASDEYGQGAAAWFEARPPAQKLEVDASASTYREEAGRLQIEIRSVRAQLADAQEMLHAHEHGESCMISELRGKLEKMKAEALNA